MGRGSFQGEDSGGFAARNLAAYYEQKEADTAIDSLNRLQQEIAASNQGRGSPINLVPEDLNILSQILQRESQFRGPVHKFNPIPFVKEAKAVYAERQEIRGLQQAAQTKLGQNLSFEQVQANKQLVKDAINQSDRATKFTPRSRGKISFDDLANEYNFAVEEHSKKLEDIQKETNPIIFNFRAQKELPEIEGKIKAIGEDYTKLAETVEKHQPRLVDVSDYGKYRNRFKGIETIRSRISSRRAEIAAETDPFKKEASRIIDEPNLENLERQLEREQKQVKQDMGQSFIARGSSGQVPQIVGGPITPYLVPSFRTQRQKSNMLAGLPELGDVGAMMTQRDIKRMQRSMTRQPRQRKSQIDKFLNFNFG